MVLLASFAGFARAQSSTEAHHAHLMEEFTPHLEILPGRQRQIWSELTAFREDFVLYGGTALGLQLPYRESVDFDFFASRPVDALQMAEEFPMLRKAQLREMERNTATFELDGVKLSFFGGFKYGMILQPRVTDDIQLPVASTWDIFAHKLKAVLSRDEAKDYMDIYHLMENGHDLETGIGSLMGLHPEVNPRIVVETLHFQKGGDLESLPREIAVRIKQEALREMEVNPFELSHPVIEPPFTPTQEPEIDDFG